jgi:glycosyltransferase involved in cell wall biosynthesis
MRKLSIILPTLRYSNAIDCIASIEANSYTDYEVIIVSTDDIITFLKGSGINLSRCKFVKDDKCNGTTYAINKGLKVAEGEYIVTLSDDCRVCSHWDDHMTEALDMYPKTDVVLGNFRVFDKTGEMPHIGYFQRLFSMFPILSRQSLNKLGCYYAEEYKAFYSDPDLGIRVSLEPGGLIYNSENSFIYHPYNPDNLHINNKNKYFEKDEETFKNKWKCLGEFKGCEVISE